MRGSSMADIGDYNEKLVLQTFRGAPDGIGQAEVVRRSHLSRQAVSLITRRLLADGLIEFAGRRIDGPGKPRTLLRVVADARLAVGVHLDPVHITVVICDLAARPLARSVLGPPTAAPDEDIGRIAAEIDRLALAIGARGPGTAASEQDAADAEAGPRRVLLGIGVATPGGLDSAAGVVRNPPWMTGWRDVAIIDALQRATGLPALLDKDTNAALTGEIWTRHLPTDETVLYLYVGHGIGSAVSADGVVHRGGTTQAGEIGHLPTGRPGPRCDCGKHGCLNLFTDAPVLIARARDAGVPLARGADVNAALADLAAAADDGHPQATAVIADHGAALGEALGVLGEIHDPQRIIIGGPAWAALAPHALPPLHQVVDPWVEEKAAVLEPSHLSDDVGAIGAATLFLEQELSPATGVSGSERRPAMKG